jgi:hypothetical protein
VTLGVIPLFIVIVAGLVVAVPKLPLAAAVVTTVIGVLILGFIVWLVSRGGLGGSGGSGRMGG